MFKVSRSRRWQGSLNLSHTCLPLPARARWPRGCPGSCFHPVEGASTAGLHCGARPRQRRMGEKGLAPEETLPAHAKARASESWILNRFRFQSRRFSNKW